MIYATAGHVDHGKTSLVKALSGIDTDRLAEEKARGLTIDLGFAYCDNGSNRIGFVDVPGHAKFISNMLAGVSTIDHALIIIAADDGPMPQTLEHIAILELLGIRNATFVITKIDRVSTQHLEATRADVIKLIATTQFVSPQIIETSTEDLRGIETLRALLFDQSNNKSIDLNHYFRLAVDRKFTIKGTGVVVTGSVFSGQVNVGDDLWIMPQKQKVRLRGLHRQDESAETASLGDRCSLNLAGDIEQSQIARGHWVTNHPDLPVSRRLDIQLKLLGSETVPLKTGTPVHIHLGAQHTTGRVFLLSQRQLQPDSACLAQIVSETDLSGCYNDKVVLRDQTANRTLAGGVVIDPFSVQKGRSRPNRLELLTHLEQQLAAAIEDPSVATFEKNIEAALAYATDGLNIAQYCAGQNTAMSTASPPVDAKGLAYDPKLIETLKQKLVPLLKSDTQTLKQITQALAVRTSLAKLVLEQLQRDKVVTQQGGLYQLALMTPSLSPPAEALWKKVEPILRETPLQPPVISELAKKVNLPVGALDKLLGECIKQKLVEKPVKNRYFLSDALQQIRQVASTVAQAHDGAFTVIEFRDHCGLGRNLCIELLEHLDNKGFTKRLGDKRVIQDNTR